MTKAKNFKQSLKESFGLPSWFKKKYCSADYLPLNIYFIILICCSTLSWKTFFIAFGAFVALHILFACLRKRYEKNKQYNYKVIFRYRQGKVIGVNACDISLTRKYFDPGNQVLENIIKQERNYDEVKIDFIGEIND